MSDQSTHTVMMSHVDLEDDLENLEPIAEQVGLIGIQTSLNLFNFPIFLPSHYGSTQFFHVFSSEFVSYAIINIICGVHDQDYCFYEGD